MLRTLERGTNYFNIAEIGWIECELKDAFKQDGNYYGRKVDVIDSICEALFLCKKRVGNA